jgi:uncharacterized RDD family membrane protein YckC
MSKKISALESSTGINLISATRETRILNSIIDYAIFYVFTRLMAIIGLKFFVVDTKNIVEEFIVVICVFVYYIFFESVWSKTPAKFITKTRVVMENGKKPDFHTIIKRTLIRLVPFEGLTFLFSERPRGWHDKWSKTFVINDK